MEKEIEVPQIKPDLKTGKKKTETETPAFPKPEEKETEQPDANTIKLGEKEDKPKKAFIIRSRKFKKAYVILTVVILFILFIGGLLLNVFLKGKKVISDAYQLQDAVKSQDIANINTKLADIKISLSSLQSSYKLVSWIKFVPFVGGYVSDGNHLINAGVYGVELGQITLQTIEPYSDLIGLKGGQQASDGEKTAADRIDFIVKTIPSLMPKMDEISAKANQVKEEVDMVNPDRYPENIAGKNIRSSLQKGIDLVDNATRLITDGKPLLENAPYFLGIDSERTYLVIFQNDKELRPTGGFLTAYSIMNVNKGKFQPVSSNDIYNIDAKYLPSIPAPQPIIDYIKGPYILSKNLRLRDMNWSPDFYESMNLFTKEAQKVGVKEIDGVIAVDTQLLVNLLDVIGPVGVPGFGNFTTEEVPECGCPQVIHELESFADVEGPIVWDPVSGKVVYTPPNSDNRKKIIGPLMNSILSNAMGQPKEKIPALSEAIFNSLMEKHVLFYMLGEDQQKAVESFGIAGRLSDTQGDYLYINDANLGGRKSNLYVTQEVSEDISISADGTVEKTVTITYNNPEKQDGWLNSVLPNWVRIYVPKGSNLITFEGVENQQEPYEELGKTVFAGYFELRPQGVAKVTVKYSLPFKVDKTYNYLLQKQPGKDSILYNINIGKKEEEFILKSDITLKYRI